MKKKILAEAKLKAANHFECGEVNATLVAEDVAHTLGHDEWLDEPDHLVFEVALVVAESCCIFCGTPKYYKGPDCPNCGSDPAFNVSDSTTV
tara:strand:+ start:23559 stop:23834 length:276 start_codon:yes stop_codon:yes gene_type:complete